MATKITGTNTAAAPGVTGDDADTGLFYGTNEIGFSTGGTSRATLDSSGRLLLGTSTIGQNGEADALTVYQAGHTGITIRTGGTSNNTAIYFADGTTTDQNYRGAITYTHADDNLVFKTAAANRLRINSSGQVLLNIDAPRSNFNDSSIETKLQIEAAGDNDSAALSIISNAGTSNSDKRSGLLVLGRTRGTSNGANTVVVQDDQVGMIEFKGMDGTSFTTAALIKAQVDGAVGTDDMPGRLVFSTSADGSGVPTERLRIDSSGNVGIGSTSPVSQLELKNTNNGTPVGSTTTMSVNNTLTFTDTDTSATSDQCVGSINFKSSDSDGAGVNSAIGGTQSNTAYGQLDFNTGKAGASGNAAVQRRVRIDHNGLNLLTGNVIVANGSGIDFSATSHASGMASELFDTYEEGSWTPTMLDGNGSNTTITVDGNNCYYTRVGNLVHVFWVVTLADTGKTGIMQMRSLPFDILRFAVCGTWWLDESSPSAGDAVGGSVYANEGNEELRFVYTTNEWQQASHRYLEFGDWANGRPMYGSAIYKTT